MQREVLSEAIWMVRTLITISSFCITQFTPGFLQNTSMHDFYFEWEVEYTTNGKEILIFVLINSCAGMLSLIWLFATPWTVAHQAPLFMEFSRQEYWSRMPFPTPADLPNPGIEPESLVLADRFFITESPGKPHPLKTAVSTS